ncbi:MAG: transmembrane fragile-X-F protein-domain-containing protein [Linnemannia gamsii]|nr:MAG: transmembrane fragile-X-F protein-domain-containing protein [Linnemannia gamsii]
MDRNTFHLYETLGIPKSSTQEEIKKTYRRLALRYHPDKVNTSEVPDHETRPGTVVLTLVLVYVLFLRGNQFRDIAAAYEVLGNPKKRQVYDRYGMMGVQMAGTEIGARLVEIESLLCKLFMALSFVITLITIFFALLSLRVDGKVGWNYAIVFIPLWIMDVFLFFGTLSRLVELSSAEEEDEHHDHDGHDGDDGTEHGEGSSTGADREERQRQKKSTKKRNQFLSALVGLLNLILFTAFQVLIVKKANDPSSVSGSTVFAPYFVLEGFFFLLAITQVAVGLREAAVADAPLSTKLGLVFEGLWWKVMRLVLAFLIMLRIDNTITCSWQIVFIPLYLVAIKYLFQHIRGYRTFSRMQNAEMRQQGQAMMTASACTFAVLGSLVYSLVGLLAAKLDGHAYSASRVLIPVFMVLSILLCCSGCCLPCMLLASGVGVEGDEQSPEAAQVRVVHPKMRIEGTDAPPSPSCRATPIS